MDILTLLTCCSTLTSSTLIGQLAIIAQAMLTMTGRVTMLNLSRWTSEGGSYRTIQRFFASSLPWSEILVEFFHHHLFDQSDEYILGGDATTITKAGHRTHGLDRFFSGVLGQVVKGLEFFVFSLISVKQRKSYPILIGQTVRSEEEKAVLRQRRAERQKKALKKKRARKRGRPKGVKGKKSDESGYSAELLRINRLLGRLLKLIGLFVKVRYVVLDGHFGHAQAVLMAQENGLELVSKLRYDAALYEKYEGEYKGRGRRKKYGAKLNYGEIPRQYLKKSESQEGVTTNYYQGEFLSRKFTAPLNVVIIERKDSCVGINDLKSHIRGAFYALETIKMIEPKAERILIEKVKEYISRIGSIHRYGFSASSA